MALSDRITDWIANGLEWIQDVAARVAHLYKPATLKEKGLIWAASLFVITLVLVTAVVGWFWNEEPDSFDVHQVAFQRAGGNSDDLVTGYIFTSTVINIGDVLLNKRGGYLSNDMAPPGVFMDNMPNWEFGALVMLRDAAGALRNHFSRSQSQSVEDKDLAKGEPQFNFQNDSWMLPATESEYQSGLDAITNFLNRMPDVGERQAQFYARADNLRLYLEIVEKRMGSLSQRLSASVGQVRVNTDLAGDNAAAQSTRTAGTLEVQTPWTELDDVFYEARGAAWALKHILIAVEKDFEDILRKKNALLSLRQIVRELEATQEATLSPVILNGGGFGLFANYSLTMANYLARANAALIDLRNLLEQG